MTVKQLKDKIFPMPKEAKVLPGTVKLASCRIDVQAEGTTVAASVELLQKELAAAGIKVSDCAETVITLTKGTAPEGLAFPEQSYRITAEETSVRLEGFGDHGLYYAVTAFVQLLGGEVTCCEITDWPDFYWRGHKIESRYFSDMMEKEDWFELIDDLSRQRINHLEIASYGCWVVQYDGRVSEYLYIPLDGYPELKTPFQIKYFDPEKKEWVRADKLPPMFEKNFFGELVAYGHARGMKVYPGFNSYGHNTLIPNVYRDVSAKSPDGEPTLTGFCTSNPKTYEMLFDMYDQIIDKYLAPYGVDCFDVTLDEVWPEIAQNAEDIFRRRDPWCKCEKCRGMEPGEMFIKHAITIFKHLKEKGMKHVCFACDMLIDHGPFGVGVLTEPLLKALKENDLMDVVTVRWWTYADLQEKLMYQTTQPETGLQRILCPWNGYYAWCVQCNSVRNTALLAKMATEEKALGINAYSSWDLCQDRNNHLFAEYGWGYGTAGSIADVTDRYLKQNFPTKFEKARRAFQLFDYITEERIDQPEGNSSCLANYFMLRDRLSYYFYSYVEDNKPYPRIFPGEALEKVCARREDHVRAMLQITGMAKEAKAIWEEIMADPACDRRRAERYAYEAHNYQVLVDDYLAMLRMMELTEESEYTAVRELALCREAARIELMAHLKQVKEHYNYVHQLRNHSIFMQFFRDLADYIEKTPEAEMKLDWFDMRYLASERFFWLR